MPDSGKSLLTGNYVEKIQKGIVGSIFISNILFYKKQINNLCFNKDNYSI